MPVSSLGLSAFLTSQGPEEKEESQPNSGNSPCEESLVSCIVSSVAPELSHRGTEEAGAGGLVSRRPEVKCLLMCRCGKDSGRSPRHTEEPGWSLRVGAATREPPAWDFAPATVERTEKSNLKDMLNGFSRVYSTEIHAQVQVDRIGSSSQRYSKEQTTRRDLSTYLFMAYSASFTIR